MDFDIRLMNQIFIKMEVCICSDNGLALNKWQAIIEINYERLTHDKPWMRFDIVWSPNLYLTLQTLIILCYGQKLFPVCSGYITPCDNTDKNNQTIQEDTTVHFMMKSEYTAHILGRFHKLQSWTYNDNNQVHCSLQPCNVRFIQVLALVVPTQLCKI